MPTAVNIMGGRFTRWWYSRPHTNRRFPPVHSVVFDEAYCRGMHDVASNNGGAACPQNALNNGGAVCPPLDGRCRDGTASAPAAGEAAPLPRVSLCCKL